MADGNKIEGLKRVVAAFLPIIYNNIWIPFKRDETETRCKSNYIESVGLLLALSPLSVYLSVSLSLFPLYFLFHVQMSMKISRETVTIVTRYVWLDREMRSAIL